MFRQARIKLTLQYSVIFLLLFWILSLGIYFWMNRYFGDRGSESYIRINHERSILENNIYSTEPPSDIILDELRNVLLLLDLSLLFIVPPITWFLTGRTLAPVQKAHVRERQFLTNASHDLRTPLSILSGELELMLQKDRTNEEYKKTMQSNKEEVNDLIALVENMLFFARENKQIQSMVKEPIDLTDVIAERIAAFQTFAKKKMLLMSFEMPDQSIVIYGYPQLLKRLLTNLLDNAVKYTPSNGKIIVKLIQEKQMAIITISDTGVGIPQEQQEKVFDRFFRADISRTHKGYGLGLSIVKQIVENHKGAIHLQSKIGKGTIVTISFPISKQIPGKNQS